MGVCVVTKLTVFTALWLMMGIDGAGFWWFLHSSVSMFSSIYEIKSLFFVRSVFSFYYRNRRSMESVQYFWKESVVSVLQNKGFASENSTEVFILLFTEGKIPERSLIAILHA